MKKNSSLIKAGALITSSGASRNQIILLFFLFFLNARSAYPATFPVNERTKIYTEEIASDSLMLKIDNTLAVPISAKFEVELQNLENESGRQFLAVVPANTLGYILATFKKTDHMRPYKCSYHWKIVLGDISKAPDNDYSYEYPFQKGSSYKVSQGPGGHISHKNMFAFDFAMPIGTTVTATRDGIVALTKSDSRIGGPDKKFIDDANFVSVYHNDGTIGTYLHLNTNGVTVTEGQVVKRGEIIGYSGNTGYSSGPHLHFEVTRPGEDFVNNKWINFQWEPRTNGLLSVLFKGH